jgi:hypothetical protein
LSVLPSPIGLPLAALAFVLPGLVLIRREEWTRADPVELAAVSCAGSVAWWAAGIWFLGWLHIPLSVFAIGSLAVAALILALARRSAITVALTAWRASPAPALWSLVFVVATVGLRAIFAFTRLACSAGDMSAHAYMAELVVMRNGLPETYEPFLPLRGFGSFPPGFHALAAVETLLGGIPTYRSTIHVQCFSLAVMTFTLAALLRGLGVGRAGAALGAAGALALARNPQFFERWGGGPTLLAAALIFLVLRDGLRLTEPCSTGLLARLGLLSAGALLTHQLPVVSFLYVFPVVIALRAGRDSAAWIRVARNGAIVAAVSGALAMPFFRRLPLSIPPDALVWAHNWFRHELEDALRLQLPALHALGAGLAERAGPETWPFYVISYLGLPAAALLAFGLTVRWLRERGQATTLATALVVVQMLLFAGAIAEILPLWPSLYPTRTGIWLLPALAIALAGLGSLALARVGRQWLFAGGILWIALVAVEGVRLRSADRFGTFYYGATGAGHLSRGRILRILANEAMGGAFWLSTFDRQNAPLGPDDLRAFAWIRENTAPRAVFATNYGDGGDMIAAVAHRPVINPHFNLEMLYQRELEEWQRRTPIDYIYVSSEAGPNNPRTYTAEALDHDPAVEPVFRAGEARVWKVRQPKPVQQLGLSP